MLETRKTENNVSLPISCSILNLPKHQNITQIQETFKTVIQVVFEKSLYQNTKISPKYIKNVKHQNKKRKYKNTKT